MKIEWNTCFKIGISIFILYLGINYWPTIIKFAGLFISASSPLIIGAVIAYLINILMVFYDKYFKKNKYRKIISLVLSILTLVTIIFLVIGIVIPEFISCISLLLQKLPGALDIFFNNLYETNILPSDIGSMLAGIDWQSKINDMINLIYVGFGNVMDIIIKTITSVFSSLVTALIAIIFAMYILVSKEKLGSQLKRLLKHYLSDRIYRNVNYVCSIFNESFHNYIVGQCLEAVILGTLCMLGMLILRLPYATMIGALIAFTALIPVAGAYIGAIVGAFMIMTISPMQAFIFLIYLVILQQIEGNLIYPKVVGTSMGLPSILILSAVTIGGGVMGILGMLLAVPLTAAIYRLIKNDINGVYKF